MDTPEQIAESQNVIPVELSGNEIENKVVYYKELTKQLLHHIETNVVQTTSADANITFPEEAAQAHKNIVDRYIVCLQKFSKWQEFYSFFCISNTLNVLGKQTSLQDAIETRNGFEELFTVWKTASYRVSNKTFIDRLQKEPTLDGILSQQQSIASIIHAYDAAIMETKTKKIQISVNKQFFEL